ncbi:MAG: DNA repair protein RecN [Elusimicrobiota bacterium]
MIRELLIKNFALIEEARIEFGPGLNVLTGETGAGKSILLAALGLILGERADPNLVRQGGESCSVSGFLTVPENEPVCQLLQKHNLNEENDSEILIHRELNLAGKNRCYINGCPVTLSILADLGTMLVDIHGQHDHQALLKTEQQREMLDTYGELTSLHHEVKELFFACHRLDHELRSLAERKEEQAEKLDLLRFQEQEISQAQITPEEESRLMEESGRLTHAEKLQNLVNEARELFYEGEGCAQERLAKTTRLVTACSQLDPSIKDLAQKFEELNLALEDTAGDLRDYIDKIEFNPQRLEEVIARQQLYQRLKNKYGATVEEVIAFGENVKKDLEQFSQIGQESSDLTEQRNEAAGKLKEKKSLLFESRRKIAEKLFRAVEKQFSDLGLKLAKLKVVIKKEEESTFTAFEEKDAVEFLFAPNLGEGLRPLAKIVSGGELSRVMLALKTVLAEADNIPILIFDEIDTGVSGTMGATIGKKLLQLAGHRQVICVTHLPQIASCGDLHFLVSKMTKSGRTLTGVNRLNREERTKEIARMLSGEKITPTAIQHAEELLKKSG